MPEEAVRTRLGEPTVARRVGHDRWLVYARDPVSLRLRLEALDREVPFVRSWTVTFGAGRDSFEGACEAVGVTPAPGDGLDAGLPPAPPSAPGTIRRPLPDEATSRVHSLTAHARAGRIRSLTAFDEPPDWRPDEAVS